MVYAEERLARRQNTGFDVEMCVEVYMNGAEVRVCVVCAGHSLVRLQSGWAGRLRFARKRAEADSSSSPRYLAPCDVTGSFA